MVRFEGMPGEFSQHDFGSVSVVYGDGTSEKVHFFASRLKAGGPFLAILRDAAENAILGDSESPDNLGLGARALTTKLCGEHAKGLTIARRMLEDGLDATEVGPLLVFTDHADQVVDLGGPMRDHR